MGGIMKIITFLFGLTLALSLAGCAGNQPITKLGADTYTMNKVDYSGIFGNIKTFRISVIDEANAFAEREGKIAVPVSAKSIPLGVGQTFASFEYSFRLADKNDKAAAQIHLVPGSDVVVDGSGKVIDAGGGQASQVDNLYSELTKLEKLKKEGLLTDAEFQAQKQKLLSGQ
jgi:hypothetical protein